MKPREHWIDEELPDWVDQVERLLIARLGMRDLARDLAHEAAIRLLDQVRTGKVPPAPRAWLMRTAHHLAIDEIRRRLPAPIGIEAQSLLRGRNEGASEVAWCFGDRVVERGELLEQLPRSLDRLPEHYQRLLRLHYFGGLDCERLSVAEELSLANTKVRLHRARRRLRDLLLGAVHDGSGHS